MSHLTHQDCVLLHNKSRHIPTSTFEEFRDLAKHLIGHYFNYNDNWLTQLVSNWKALRKKSYQSWENFIYPLKTIPGISTFGAATIIGEFGDSS